MTCGRVWRVYRVLIYLKSPICSTSTPSILRRHCFWSEVFPFSNVEIACTSTFPLSMSSRRSHILATIHTGLDRCHRLAKLRSYL